MPSIEEFGKPYGWKEESFEVADEIMEKSGYPAPKRAFHIVYESFSASVEETYFWILTHLQQDWAFPHAIKITDVFSASENSAFFGQSQQRLGIQQDRASQYLALIGKMIKDLFALVREMRIIDERLYFYHAWEKSKAADVTLKGLYIDLVEGGTKSPSSVYGLAQQVGFTTLPDLFFNSQVYKEADVDSFVDKLAFNPSVKNVLKRKLLAFIIWKIKTQHELEARRLFNLRYLRQHWAVIKMYMAWVKPYLKNITRLTMNDKAQDSAELISAFEGSMMEIETLVKKPMPDYKKTGYNSVVLLSFKYRTRPHMNFRQEYQQGPVHSGRIDCIMRAYGWHDKEVEAYQKYREQEDMEMLGMVDSSVKAAMEALGDELNKYLEEAGEKIEKKAEPEKPKQAPQGSIIEPFVEVFKGFGEIFTSVTGTKEKKTNVFVLNAKAKDAAGESARFYMYSTYKNYKKSHGMLSW
ncbi:MAG: hypothetical protein ABIA93_01955 [Candidatus Woesearchaeota archaeon]